MCNKPQLFVVFDNAVVNSCVRYAKCSVKYLNGFCKTDIDKVLTLYKIHGDQRIPQAKTALERLSEEWTIRYIVERPFLYGYYSVREQINRLNLSGGMIHMVEKPIQRIAVMKEYAEDGDLLVDPFSRQLNDGFNDTKVVLNPYKFPDVDMMDRMSDERIKYIVFQGLWITTLSEIESQRGAENVK